MNRITATLLVTGPFALLAACLASQNPALPAAGEKKEQTRKIELDSVYSTSRQKGLKSAGHVEAFFEDARRLGASNIFLVRGDTFKAALKATSNVFNACGSADVASTSNDAGPLPTDCWLVVYFGIGHSQPPAWLLESVERKANTIRLSFRTEIPGEITRDLHQYFVWAPLGELEPGLYTLELFDASDNELKLLRKIRLGKR